MKKLMYLLILSISVLGVYMLNSCNKESINKDNVTTEKITSKSDLYSQTMCCEVSCKGGKCTAYQSPCSCTCSYWGDRPICSGNTSHFDLDPIHISNIDGMVSKLTSFNDYFADSAAIYFENFKDAVMNNNQALAKDQIEKYDLVKVKMSTNNINQYRSYIDGLDYE